MGVSGLFLTELFVIVVICMPHHQGAVNTLVMVTHLPDKNTPVWKLQCVWTAEMLQLVLIN